MITARKHYFKANAVSSFRQIHLSGGRLLPSAGRKRLY